MTSIRERAEELLEEHARRAALQVHRQHLREDLLTGSERNQLTNLRRILSQFQVALLAVSSQKGLDWLPKDWPTMESAPKDGTPILVYADVFVNADFNPTGVIEAYWHDDEGWLGAMWNPQFDEWDTTVVQPTCWSHQPRPPQHTPSPPSPQTEGSSK